MHATYAINLVFSFIFVFFSFSCDTWYEDTWYEQQDFYTTVEFSQPVPAKYAFGIVGEKDVWGSNTIVTIAYGEQNFEWRVEEALIYDQMEKLKKSQKDQLDYLIPHFDPNNEMEASVYYELQEALTETQNEDDVQITRMVLEGDYLDAFHSKPYVKRIEKTPKKPKELDEDYKFATQEQAILDWTDDAPYMPVAGTSTVWPSGTLQKFWFDEQGLAYHQKSWRQGFEIDVVITTKDKAGCSLLSSWSSNLPSNYNDAATSGIGDSSKVSVCTIGTFYSKLAKANKLYWNWYGFSDFKESLNPKFTVQFQSNLNKCTVYPSVWCMFENTAELPRQWIIEYNYNEAPGVEIPWYRN